MKNYEKLSERTEAPITEATLQRIAVSARLLHSAMGMVTEAAEALDMLKKNFFYGKPLDLVNFSEEIGDGQYYAAMGANALGQTLDEIQTINFQKLFARYGDKFSEDRAINRDLETEREILEQKIATPAIFTVGND